MLSAPMGFRDWRAAIERAGELNELELHCVLLELLNVVDLDTATAAFDAGIKIATTYRTATADTYRRATAEPVVAAVTALYMASLTHSCSCVERTQ